MHRARDIQKCTCKCTYDHNTYMQETHLHKCTHIDDIDLVKMRRT